MWEGFSLTGGDSGSDWLTNLTGPSAAGYSFNAPDVPSSSWYSGLGSNVPTAQLDSTLLSGQQPSSWFSDLMGGLGSAARIATPLLGLGTAGLGLYSGIRGMQEAADVKQQNRGAQQIQQQAAQTALNSGQQLTNAGTAAMMGGALPEGLEAQARQWEDAYRAQVNQYLAKAGLGTSTTAAQWDPYIKQQAAIYRQQLASGLLAPGQTGLQTASQAGSALVGGNQATQTGIGTVLQSANQALAALQAASGQPIQRQPGQAY